MEKKYLWVLIIFLALANAYALYKQKSISNKASEVINNSFLDSYISSTFRNVNKSILFGGDILEALPGNDEREVVQIYFMFRGSDCTNCITETWEMLEGLINNTNLTYEHMNFYYYPDDLIDLSTLISMNNIRWLKREDVIEFNYEKVLLDSDINISPLLIVARAGVVLDAYQPEPGNLVTRDAFWKKWERLLQLEII